MRIPLQNDFESLPITIFTPGEIHIPMRILVILYALCTKQLHVEIPSKFLQKELSIEPGNLILGNAATATQKAT